MHSNETSPGFAPSKVALLPQAQGASQRGGGGFPEGGLGGDPALGNLANDKIQEFLSVSVIRRIIYIYIYMNLVLEINKSLLNLDLNPNL